jgi:hypothetical protein
VTASVTIFVLMLAGAGSAYAASGSLGVFLDFDVDPSAESVAAMKQEVETLLAPSGIRLDWRTLDERGAEEFADLVVMRFHGRCDTQGIQILFSELGPYGEAMIFGSAATESGRVQPFGALACDHLRKSVARQLAGQAARDEVFGRAMGRVVAHELYHMLTGEKEHSSHGVFRASQRAAELLAPGFQFTPREQGRLRMVAARLSTAR